MLMLLKGFMRTPLAKRICAAVLLVVIEQVVKKKKDRIDQRV